MRPLGPLLVAVLVMTSGTAFGLSEPSAVTVTNDEVSRTINRTHTYQYAIAFPPDYAEEGDRRWPMVVDLHGSGQPSIEKQMRIAADRDRRFVWLLPRHDGNGWWDPGTLAKLIRQVRDRHRVDPDRISVIGFSMGGFGTWDLAAEYPHLIAAIAPMAGGGNPFKAQRLTHVPVWAFHGQRDDAVGIELAEAMVGAVERAGGEARLTVYPNVGHHCQGLALSNGRFYEWLLAQRRGTRARNEWVARSGRAPRLQGSPILDGTLSDPAWRDAASLTGFMRPLAVAPAAIQTEVSLGHTATHLYVGLTAWDPDISRLEAERNERDAEIWLDDSMEVLIDTDGDGRTYFQFVANAHGALYDSEGFDKQWNAEGIELAAGIHEDRWTVELAIPWKALGRTAPQAGETLNMLFARNHPGRDQHRYYTQWPPTNGKGNHAPDHFAPILFGASEHGE